MHFLHLSKESELRGHPYPPPTPYPIWFHLVKVVLILLKCHICVINLSTGPHLWPLEVLLCWLMKCPLLEMEAQFCSWLMLIHRFCPAPLHLTRRVLHHGLGLQLSQVIAAKEMFTHSLLAACFLHWALAPCPPSHPWSNCSRAMCYSPGSHSRSPLQGQPQRHPCTVQSSLLMRIRVSLG